MPFSPQQIDPVDLNPNVAVGVNLPLNGPAVFISNFTTKDSIKNNLINFFLTNPGERYLNPNFGGGLRAFVFEQMNDGNLNALQDNINGQLSLYFPKIIINSLNLLKKEEENTLVIQLKYSILNSNINDELIIQF